MKITKPQIFNLPKIEDERGNLSFFESMNQIPFQIKRAYWIYDVPGGYERGGHAFKTQQEFIIALSGSFDVSIDDSCSQQVFSLNRSYYGLYIPAGYWRSMTNFSTNSLALVTSSIFYSEDDYLRNYDDFINFLKK